jgi:molecular chaperone GrpE
LNNRYALRRQLYQVRTLFNRPAPAPAASADARDDSGTQALEQELTQLRELVIRQRAEFDNFRKRTQREKEQVREAAAETLFGKLLPVLDNLERALASTASANDVKSLHDGVTMIMTQLQRAMETEGLQRVDALHQPFDPTRHDALATEERSDVPDNHVCEVLLPGYSYKERLLRPAMVKVARRAAEPEATSGVQS